MDDRGVPRGVPFGVPLGEMRDSRDLSVLEAFAVMSRKGDAAVGELATLVAVMSTCFTALILLGCGGGGFLVPSSRGLIGPELLLTRFSFSQSGSPQHGVGGLRWLSEPALVDSPGERNCDGRTAAPDMA